MDNFRVLIKKFPQLAIKIFRYNFPLFAFFMIIEDDLQTYAVIVIPEHSASSWNPSSISFTDDTVACTLQRLLQNACNIYSRHRETQTISISSAISIVCQESKKTITFHNCTASLLLCPIQITIGNSFGGP